MNGAFALVGADRVFMLSARDLVEIIATRSVEIVQKQRRVVNLLITVTY